MSSLCTVMNKHGSDKGSGHHNYTTYYSELFKHLVNKSDVNIFEVGIGTTSLEFKSSMGPSGVPGASLRGWREWFGNAHIYGADIDPDIMISEDRIKTFVVDQTSTSSIQNLWKNFENIKFDVMIDDGLHEWHANHRFLINSYFKLKEGGIYVVEDIHELHVPEFDLSIDIYKRIFQTVELIKIPNPLNEIDNTILVCRI